MNEFRCWYLSSEEHMVKKPAILLVELRLCIQNWSGDLDTRSKCIIRNACGLFDNDNIYYNQFSCQLCLLCHMLWSVSP